ncbi:MFS antiporter QDR3 [Cytospora mali]|uniref:MFS antiporter QDR3 n=1 Tax=Cytospora mali TaxID=578113 RepID=A0A194VVL2_CYTMA|nr:MFS antiporter QDR3 [Valsa mali]
MSYNQSESDGISGGGSTTGRGSQTDLGEQTHIMQEKELVGPAEAVGTSEKPKIEAQSPAPRNDVPNETGIEQTRALVIVPRSERRGLFGHFAIIPEVTNPYDYGHGTKWAMTIIVALAAATSSTGTSIFYPALGMVAKDLHTSRTVANLTLAFYLLAMAFTPLWWSAFSEKLGRRTIYMLSFSLFMVFSILSAVSVNIAMLIVFRVLTGGASASVQAVGAGTVSDIWEPKQRGKAMGIFYLGPLCGPGLAPIIGGALAQGLGWRSTLWFLVIFGGVLLLLIFFCLPETLKRKTQVDLDNEAAAARKPRATQIFRKFVDPIKVLTLLRYPPVLISVFSAATAFSALYVVNVSVQAVFETSPYNFTTVEVGLLYLAPTLGYAVASLLGGRWIDYIMVREAKKAGRFDADGKPIYLPEDRMKENIWLAASLYPAGLIWYGWSVDKALPWIVACIANFFFGIGSMLVFGAVTTMLTEFTPKKSSSGVAVNNFVRNIIACIATVVTQPLLNAMGPGWMCTMVGLFAFVTGNASILAIKLRGPKWRVIMDTKLNAGQSTNEKK